MRLEDAFKLTRKTRFRLLVDLYICGFGFFAVQGILYLKHGRSPLQMLLPLPILFYVIAVSKELKTRHEQLTRREKHFRFGMQAGAYAIAVVGLLVAGIVKNTPQLWICFGLVTVVSFVILFHAYEQTYREDGQA
jgi:hypothetical protein